MEEVYEKSIFEEDQIEQVYAGFWERFGALFLDGLILLPLTLINLLNHTMWKSMALMIVVGLAALVYKPLFEYLYGATLGKKALSIAVTGKSYGKPTLQEAGLRNIFGVVFGLLSMVSSILVFSQPMFKQATSMSDYSLLERQTGYSLIFSGLLSVIYIVDAIVLLADKRNRSLHDFIAGTYVVKRYRNQ